MEGATLKSREVKLPAEEGCEKVVCVSGKVPREYAGVSTETARDDDLLHGCLHRRGCAATQKPEQRALAWTLCVPEQTLSGAPEDFLTSLFQLQDQKEKRFLLMGSNRGERRILEWFMLEGTLKLIQFQPLPTGGQGHLTLEQLAPSPCVLPGLEHCRGRGSLSFSGHPVPAPQHPHREELLPESPSQSPLWQVQAIPPWPVPTRPCPKPLSRFLVAPVGTGAALRFPPLKEPVILQAEQAHLSQPGCGAEVLQPSQHLHGFLWLTYAAPRPSGVGAQDLDAGLCFLLHWHKCRVSLQQLDRSRSSYRKTWGR
ncbi:uncharacterized protein LOC136004991 isoform X2 [Lathamus discolor]|uniref:uncharacterized protein LOC136004991 isoform X2 n=1 Tax=Lathamus discolor TaxID=678569 RepID=UPI0032B7EE66